MKTNRQISNFNAPEESHRAELNAAAAKMKIHEVERLAFTDDAASAVATSGPATKRRSTLLEAFPFWVLSRS
jgi:hypothetical protein